jgi:hypothetical protein
MRGTIPTIVSRPVGDNQNPLTAGPVAYEEFRPFAQTATATENTLPSAATSCDLQAARANGKHSAGSCFIDQIFSNPVPILRERENVLTSLEYLAPLAKPRREVDACKSR